VSCQWTSYSTDSTKTGIEITSSAPLVLQSGGGLLKAKPTINGLFSCSPASTWKSLFRSCLSLLPDLEVWTNRASSRASGVHVSRSARAESTASERSRQLTKSEGGPLSSCSLSGNLWRFRHCGSQPNLILKFKSDLCLSPYLTARCRYVRKLLEECILKKNSNLVLVSVQIVSFSTSSHSAV
jgi:hypothetical protein